MKTNKSTLECLCTACTNCCFYQPAPLCFCFLSFFFIFKFYFFSSLFLLFHLYNVLERTAQLKEKQTDGSTTNVGWRGVLLCLERIPPSTFAVLRLKEHVWHNISAVDGHVCSYACLSFHSPIPALRPFTVCGWLRDFRRKKKREE